MAERVVVIAQARMGSSRLPGKVLRRAGGATLLEHLVRRVRRAPRVDGIVIATTDTEADQEIVEEASRLGVGAWRGPVDDVLARYVGAAEYAGADVVVRVTGDCPLLDPVELERVIAAFLAGGWDYLTNQAGEVRRIPRGLDVEVMTRAALERADREATAPGDREHVTPWLYRTPGRFRSGVTHREGPDLGGLRLTVDTPADLAVVTAIFEALGADAETDAIGAWLAEHPGVAALNAGIVQKGIEGEMETRRRRIGGRLLLGRADGGPGIGFGHVARLEALLDAWVELGGRAVLRGSGIGGAIRARLEGSGVEVLDVAREPVEIAGRPVEQLGWGGVDDLAATLGDAARLGAAALAVDGYAFKVEYHRALAAVLPVLAVDDMAAFAHPADVVLNQNMDFPAERYRLERAGAALLVGHPYVLLRREFRAEAGRAAEGEGQRRVIVTFGGADPARLTAPVVARLVEAVGDDVRLVVIAGRGMDAGDQALLAALAASRPGVVEVRYDVTEMAQTLRGAALALTAAGSTVWELLACGVPPVLVAVADNQRAVSDGVARRGAGLALGWHGDVGVEGIVKAALGLLEDQGAREALAARGRAMIDGRGVYRAIDALLDAVDRRCEVER